jgi:hypothetical protein
MDDLRKRLISDPNLRRICGFIKVPSLATFSRRMSLLSESSIMEKSFETMVSEYYAGRIVGDVARDSTAIAAREKPWNKKSDVALPKPKKYRRGRPRKGEARPQKEPPVIAQHTTMLLEEALKTLDTRCSWGYSQGNVSYWKGYKIHLDVTDTGIPIWTQPMTRIRFAPLFRKEGVFPLLITINARQIGTLLLILRHNVAMQ